MTTCVALIRGINVGKAKRVAMAELRELVEGLGHRRVRTLLNSGNVVFDSASADRAALARALHAAILERTGVLARVVVVTRADLDAVVAANPLPEAVADPARFLVAFVDAAGLAGLAPLAARDWGAERLALGAGAAYLCCAGGVHESPLALAVMKAGGEAATTRNWSTVLKLQALAGAA
jgi:uncharacterized protein (DUF1697 family)